MVSYVHGKNVDRAAKPHKSLTRTLKKRSGRMKTGKLSIRRRGGGVRRRYRMVDFSQKSGEYKVERLERDPNRSSFIALISDKKARKYYVLANEKMKAGDVISVGEKTEIKTGNRMLLSKILVGSLVSNVELYPGSGGKLARSGGVCATLMAREGGMVQLKMPSGEVRLVSDKCYATIGQISNPESNMVRIGKAGRMRLMGKRPEVRGKAMNPVDHPHGGGEGNQPIGLKHPKTPWGKPALGVKTRKSNKASNKYILKRRTRKRRK